MELRKDNGWNDFAGEVKSWLHETTGYFIALEGGAQDVFPILTIAREEGRVIMEIKLIMLENWQKFPGALLEWQYYLERQTELRQAGVHSVMLWEDIWTSRKLIVKSRLLVLLGLSDKIPGRLTVPRRISKAAAAAFLEVNHLQGATLSKYQFGIFLPQRYFRVLPVDFKVDTTEEECLVAVATFSHARIFYKNGEPHRSVELIRFASLLNLTVAGGLGKLISAFVKDVAPDDIMTYADLDWSDGHNYTKMGFQFVSDKDPMRIKLDLPSLKRTGARPGAETGQPFIWIMNAGSRKFVKTIR
ncbi:hypothetical protein DYBT9275_01773 [Dyadobacter sp. CECT 9275]|uniref:Uncharacterized protein n=1 Tax=Dyadobacter helix TaxID=2822344 RepID=A0A916NBD4_9BACT|nr:hypothetical protein [Dyadobacter sp. CECT 9275]CAG4997430.1 hypothetical protein DYBT9275_01773 [Dyadobacter sp. CECT 9275]